MTTRQERRYQERQIKKQGNKIPTQGTVEMKEEYKEFIGIYDNSVPIELCNEFVENYEKAKENRTLVDMSEENETGYRENYPPLDRKDVVAYVAPVMSSIYPVPPVKAYFDYLKICFSCYAKKYSIQFSGPIYNDLFKIHKVGKSEGYHQWHYERSSPETIDRLMAYMTYLEVPKKGGETEFLHQSLRIEPIVGRTLIWPSGFTHMHRGLMPLDGEKMYITGWFKSPKVDFDAAGQ